MNLNLYRTSEPAAGRPQPSIPMPARRWKTRLLLPLTLVLALLLLLGYTSREALRPALAVQVIPVVMRSIEQAQRGGGVVTQAPGWVEPAPYPILIAAQREGIVQEVLALEGDEVQAGAVVARLLDVDARLALARANAQLARAEAAVRAARLALGEDPSHGSALAEIDAELGRQPALAAELEAKLAELDVELTGRRAAVERGLVAGVQVTLLETRLRAAEAQLDAQRRQETVLQARRLRLISELQSHLAVAIADRDIARVTVDEANLALERCEIVSPVEGVVMARLAHPGQAVRVGEPGGAAILQVYDSRQLQVRVDVPLSQAARIGVGMAAQIVVDVLPDQVFDGAVTRVMHEADISRNTLQFKVAIEQPAPQLKPQMLARVRFMAPTGRMDGESSSSQRLFAPVRIVGSEPGGTAEVWAADHTAHAIRRTITLGDLRRGGWIEVRGGLNPGDRLILDPPPGLAPGQRLSPRDVQLENDGESR